MLLVTELGKGNRMEETITPSYPESKLKSVVHFQKKKQNTRVHSCAIKLGSQLRGDMFSVFLFQSMANSKIL